MAETLYIQDGNQFYDARTGRLVWETDLVKHDYDLDGAIAAREEFLRVHPLTLAEHFGDS